MKNKVIDVKEALKMSQEAYRQGFMDGMLHEDEMLVKFGLGGKTTRKDEPIITWTGDSPNQGNINLHVLDEKRD